MSEPLSSSEIAACRVCWLLRQRDEIEELEDLFDKEKLDEEA